MGVYYLLECYGPIDRERAAIDTVPKGFAWNRGRPFTTAVPDPLEVTMDGDGIMMPMFNRGILLWRADLLDAILRAGVGNIDSYNVVLIDPVHNVCYSDYKAINVLGIVAAADLSRSDFHAPSGKPIIDTDFDSLAIDEDKARGFLLFRLAESLNAIVVHEKVKTQIEAAGIEHIDFVKPEDWVG